MAWIPLPISSNVSAFAADEALVVVAHGRVLELVVPDDELGHERWRTTSIKQLPGDARDLALSGREVCAALVDGTTRCLSTGDDGDADWVVTGGVRDAVQLSSSCAITKAGNVACRLSDGETRAKSATLVPGIKNAKRMATPFVELADGKIVRVEFSDDRKWTVTPQPLLGKLANLSNGGYAWSSACGLRDGKAWCWLPWGGDHDSFGASGRDQMGRADFATPAALDAIGPAIAVAAGNAHACAIDKDGALWCWGDDRGGGLGRGRVVHRTTPERVVGIGP